MNRTGKNTREDGKPKRRWTAAEERALRTYWGEMSLRDLARKLDRTELTTYWRARRIGLPTGCPVGYEYLTHAARRLGYCTKQLRRILKAEGVRLRRAISRPPAVGGYHIVDSFDAESAVERWHLTEDVEAAARRLGVYGGTLRRLLLEKGHKPPSRPKFRWRVASELADKLVAEWRAETQKPSIAQHAKRLGMCRIDLAKRLRAAGVLGGKQPGVTMRLANDVVDEALERAGGRAA